MKTGIMLLPLLASIFVLNQGIDGRTMTLGLEGGLPRHYEAYKNYFEDGKLWGGSIYASLASNLEIGLGISRSTWEAVDGNTLEELSFSRYYTDRPWESQGHGTITEVCISLRLLSRPGWHKKVGFFAELGYGYYLVDLNALYQNPSMCLAPNYSDPSCEEGYQVSYDRDNPGINVGVGAVVHILSRLTAEIQPSARVIFAEEDRITYYSLDVSMRYRLDLGTTEEQ